MPSHLGLVAMQTPNPATHDWQDEAEVSWQCSELRA